MERTDRTGQSRADGSCNLILYIGYILYIVKSLCDINGYVFTIKAAMGLFARPTGACARERDGIQGSAPLDAERGGFIFVRSRRSAVLPAAFDNCGDWSVAFQYCRSERKRRAGGGGYGP